MHDLSNDLLAPPNPVEDDVGVGCQDYCQYGHVFVSAVAGVLSSFMYISTVDHVASEHDPYFEVYCPMLYCNILLKICCFGLNSTLNSYWFYEVSLELMEKREKYYNPMSLVYLTLSILATINYVSLAVVSGSPAYVLLSTALIYVFLHFTGAEMIYGIARGFILNMINRSSPLSADEQKKHVQMCVVLMGHDYGIEYPSNDPAERGLNSVSTASGGARVACCSVDIRFYSHFLQDEAADLWRKFNEKYRHQNSLAWQLVKFVYNYLLVNFSILGYYVASYRVIDEWIDNSLCSGALTALSAVAFFGFVYMVSDQIMDSLFNIMPIGLAIVPAIVQKNLGIFILATISLVPISYLSLLPTFDLLNDIDFPFAKNSAAYWLMNVLIVLGAAPFNATGMLGLLTKALVHFDPTAKSNSENARWLALRECIPQISGMNSEQKQDCFSRFFLPGEAVEDPEAVRIQTAPGAVECI